MTWIPITEQLPPIDEPVLFCCLTDVGFTDVDRGWYEKNWTDDESALVMRISYDVNDWSPCSHWMPLPKPPEVQP